MPRQKIDQKVQSKSGKEFPQDSHRSGSMRGEGFASAIAAALREDFGHSGSAVKTVATITGANERAVRNWFEAKNGPAGFNLVDLMQHSDRVLEAVLLLSGRGQVARNVMLATLCAVLRDTLIRIEALTAPAEESYGRREA